MQSLRLEASCAKRRVCGRAVGTTVLHTCSDPEGCACDWNETRWCDRQGSLRAPAAREHRKRWLDAEAQGCALGADVEATTEIPAKTPAHGCAQVSRDSLRSAKDGRAISGVDTDRRFPGFATPARKGRSRFQDSLWLWYPPVPQSNGCARHMARAFVFMKCLQ